MRRHGRVVVISLFLAGSITGPGFAQTGRLPGNSHADAVLQRDTLSYVAINVGVQQRGCSQFRVVNTAFGGYDAEDAIKRPWHEIWTVTACGQTWKVPVTYVPDATGTSITVPASGPRARLP